MIKLNRGEWSELYGVLFLLVKPNIKVVDQNLKPIEFADKLFKLKQIIYNTKLELRYEIVGENVLIFLDGHERSKMTLNQLEMARASLIEKIKNISKKDGAFSIPTLSDFLQSFTDEQVLKAGSKSKADVRLLVYDSKAAKDAELSYSIKSSLGSPSTILNSSNNTNFKYEVLGLKESDIKAVNLIKTGTKLLDRINKIYKLGGKIRFSSIPSEAFEYNLKMVDTNMPQYLANALLYSYQHNTKDLKSAFAHANGISDENFVNKKLGDLLSAISFGFIPGTKWDGIKSVTGGLIVVKEDGDVNVLDLVYYEDAVRKYIINESKFDSPSSTRYKMLDLFVENGEIYFTLNLQIRYKK